jgi:YHS domain-containing protein
MRVAAAVLLCLFSGASVMAWAFDEPRVAIQGYDPVAYFTESRPVKGSAAIYEDFDGRRYHFANPRHKAMFIADPDRYVPQFGANCAALVGFGKVRAASPLYWAVVDDRLYLFARAEGPEFIARNPGVLAKARENWASMRK